MPRWTEHTRQQQRERIKNQRPWLQATGPVTPYGRRVSSQNAKKHRRRFQVARGDMVQGLENCIPALETVPECHSNVTVQRDIRMGTHVEYVGSDPAIASICGGKKLEVFAVQRGLAQCWISGIAGFVNVSLGDLQRCPDGH